MLNYISHLKCALPLLSVRTLLIQRQVDPNFVETTGFVKYVHLLASMTKADICIKYDTTMPNTLLQNVEDIVNQYQLPRVAWNEESNTRLCNDEELLLFIESNMYTLHSCNEVIHSRQCRQFTAKSFVDSSRSFEYLQRLLEKYNFFSNHTKPLVSKMKILYPDYFSVSRLYNFLGFVDHFNMTSSFDISILSYDKQLLEDIAFNVKHCAPSTTSMIGLLLVINPSTGLLSSLTSHHGNKSGFFPKFDCIEFNGDFEPSNRNLRDETELNLVR